jgi:hypothetical protein
MPVNRLDIYCVRNHLLNTELIMQHENDAPL